MTRLSIFPKFLQDVALADLGPMLADVGLRQVNCVVRNGYWVGPDDLAETLPRFVATLRAAGIGVPFATLGWSPEQVLARPEVLTLLADQGIAGFRLGYDALCEDQPLLAQLQKVQRRLQVLTPLLQQHGLRAIVQVHHGQLVNNPSCAAIVMQGLPDASFGVMLDVGNQGYEGFERWERARRILGPYWSALGVKDTRLVIDETDGRRRIFCPCDEGEADWPACARAYAASPGRDRDPWVLQPFYHPDERQRHLVALRQEVAFIESVMQEAGLEVA